MEKLLTCGKGEIMSSIDAFNESILRKSASISTSKTNMFTHVPLETCARASLGY